MITVTIWHNVAHDAEGRHAGMLDGFRPGDPMVRVFTYQADPAGRSAEEIAEEAFAICNDHPAGPDGEELARLYYRHRLLRSLSVGDLVAVGEAPLVCERAGWAPLRGGITEARIDEHGTHPLPLPDGLDAPRNAKGDPPHLGRNDEIASPTLPGEPAMAREGTQAVNKISRM